MEDPDALARFVRDEAGHLVASLTRQFGNFDLAEEAVQDAILEAARHWRTDGLPREPGAWLRVTARRKATDRLRREARFRELLVTIADRGDDQEETKPHVADDRLVLLFMCCHPSLSRKAQLALTLRSLMGLTTMQLAKAFLVSEATMTKRVVRAKRKIVDARIPLAVPSGAEAQARLGEVLTCIYLMFNEGYLSAGPEQPERAELADDADWLASLVSELVPGDPEVLGLLSLIRLHQARRTARFDWQGRLVLLQDQDRSLWDRVAIEDALATLNRALRQGKPGFFQGQAAIAGCHATARSWGETRWDTIVSLYDSLMSVSDSPVVGLNRAIAIFHRDGPVEALTLLDSLRTDLESYHLFHAARAEILRDLGRRADALSEDRRAAELTENPAERTILGERIDRESLPDLVGVFSKN